MGLAGRKAEAWPVLSCPELDPVLPEAAPLLPVTHCPPLSRKPGVFSKSVPWNKIKCEVLSGVWGSWVPLRPRMWGLAQLHPSQLSQCGHPQESPIRSRKIH